VISFHTEPQNDLIGAITVFVILDCSNAAITAIHSIANQKSSRKSCQRAFQLQAKRLSLLGFHFIHFIVSLNHHTELSPQIYIQSAQVSHSPGPSLQNL